MLEQSDFPVFFDEVYGYEPFPWQTRLLQNIVEHDGEWPAMLDLPTGSGKTAGIDIAVFHLALEADCCEARRAPVRIVFIVDRRLVVDDAFERANKLAAALSRPGGPVTARVARTVVFIESGRKVRPTDGTRRSEPQGIAKLLRRVEP